MRIIIIGAGVIGVTSAYYLQRAGHQVTVLEHHPAPAQETSFANAGQISPGYAAPWAAPGVPMKAMKWLMQEHGPLRVRPKNDPFQWQWMAKMLANCTIEAYQRNKNRMVPLAEYSRDQLKQLRADTGIEYEGRSLGTLQIFRQAKQLENGRRDADLLAKMGVAHELLDANGIARTEPALAHIADQLVGALRLPNDETGDCQLFTQQLADLAAQLGVVFRYGVDVLGLPVKYGLIQSVQLSGETLNADAIVLAAGCASRQLGQLIGLDLPVYPVKGYSITVPLSAAAKEQADLAPRSTVMDETYKIALTRFDLRLRVGGMAELAGYDKTLDPKRVATLKMVAHDLFPHAGDLTTASAWTGLRPMTPDGTPIIGATPINNLWLNTGHGTLGWTMACGSAKVLADLISGQRPEIPTEHLGLTRYG
ncbi:D-amino acid dehydrogenase [Chitinibacter bivalviorum]|uniref:D-amino acid dehydrogenase n=1 Tax=Chitinibacter bivalviorum TaxID=2739434 RepID=A0A7H9BN94_9NEIS|nr:D-amino acid dehydrogenase [Chitinibacter bivalviorum]QLG88864.1 D-amino acid dehydrogenase [Chitinibacter bivalviorum]